MGKLDGKVAIVTGAGRSLGKAFAKALAKEGAAVTIVEIMEENGRQTAAEITASGGRALFVATDINNRQQIEAAVAKTVEQFGTVDILVNNAVALPPMLPIEIMPDDDMDLVYRTGPLATKRFMQVCLPYLKRRGGKVINLASGAGIFGMANFACYSSAKEAIRALTRSAAREWGPFGINVNCICPSSTSEKMLQWKKDQPEAFFKMNGDIPLGRLGNADDDIAPVVVFLASKDSRYITGSTLMVDGGHTMLA